MRRGEILGLQWEHVDLDRRAALLPLTKNGSSREVPLSTKAAQVLDRQRQRNDTPSPFPVTPNGFRLAWDRLRSRAGLSDLRFHDLRHEAISRFFELGLNIPEVAVISGHKDPRMLFRYTHLRAEELVERLWFNYLLADAVLEGTLGNAAPLPTFEGDLARGLCFVIVVSDVRNFR